jgi:hypothetical protein
MFIEAHHKFDVPITYDKLRHPMVFHPHIEKQLRRIESCRDCFCWNHFCQLGESIDYYENDIHSI